MGQAAGIALGLLGFAAVFSIPFVILRLVARANNREFAAIDGWARRKGLRGTDASAARGVHDQVPVLSYTLGRDVVSFAVQASSRRRSFTIYLRPHGARIPGLGLQRRMMGGGGEPLGDPQLDAHFRLLHGGPPALALLCAPQVHEALIRDHAQILALTVYEGVVVLSLVLWRAADVEAWDRAWDLVGRVVGHQAGIGVAELALNGEASRLG